MATDARPTVTVFGSCRVHTPCMLLQKARAVRMNQGRIFGFTHYTAEILQQVRFITGQAVVPRRLRPYLNIPESWNAPESEVSLEDMFRDTDIFVIEVSSIRKVAFKSVFLQINRVQEMLVRDDETLRSWWNPLTRTGENHIGRYLGAGTRTALQVEIASGLQLHEQPASEIARDAVRLSGLLCKPVLFVSHFDTNYDGTSIPQRRRIVEALAGLRAGGVSFFDPTAMVQRAGLKTAIKDLGHYTEAFEHAVAAEMAVRIAALAPTRRVCAAA